MLNTLLEVYRTHAPPAPAIAATGPVIGKPATIVVCYEYIKFTCDVEYQSFESSVIRCVCGAGSTAALMYLCTRIQLTFEGPGGGGGARRGVQATQRAPEDRARCPPLHT